MDKLIKQERYIYLNGYTKKVEVLYKNSTGAYVCRLLQTEKNYKPKNIVIPTYLFYHIDQAGILVLRDSLIHTSQFKKCPIALSTEQLPFYI